MPNLQYENCTVCTFIFIVRYICAREMKQNRALKKKKPYVVRTVHSVFPWRTQRPPDLRDLLWPGRAANLQLPELPAGDLRRLQGLPGRVSNLQDSHQSEGIVQEQIRRETVSGVTIKGDFSLYLDMTPFTLRIMMMTLQSQKKTSIQAKYLTVICL